MLFFQRGSTVGGTDVSLAYSVLPGILGMMVAIGGLQGAAGSLPSNVRTGRCCGPRRSPPHGRLSHRPGGVGLPQRRARPGDHLRPRPVPDPELTGIDRSGWLTFLWVFALGLLATLLGWVQAIAQVFPIYWLGLGVRSAFLPDSAAAVEIGGSWRHLATVAVLGTWALVGLDLAPVVLRRMARRESGSNMAARRERALQRIG